VLPATPLLPPFIRGLSFLPASAFRYRVRFLVSIFSSMLRCLAAHWYRRSFLHLRLTEVHAYFCVHAAVTLAELEERPHVSRVGVPLSAYVDT